MNIVLNKQDLETIRGLVPESMVELVNRKMPIQNADTVRQYLQEKATEDNVINVLLYGSKLAKKVNCYNHLNGGNRR